LELDRPVQAVAEECRGGERWTFDCCRTTDQWKVTPTPSTDCVLGHPTGERWSFYDNCSCTHIEVIGHAGVYRVWDFGGMHPLDVTFLHHVVTLCEPASGHSERFLVEV
jgi:hypothetical protein